MSIAPCGHGDALPSGYLFCVLVIGFMTDAGVETLDDVYPIYDRPLAAFITLSRDIRQS